MRSFHSHNSSATWPLSPTFARTSPDALLLHVIDACTAGCLFLVPAILGGRHPLAHLVLVALAVGMLVAWALRVSLRRDAAFRMSPGLLLLGGGILLLTLQLLPLPAPLLALLAPEMGELLPVWGPQGAADIGLGDWKTVTLAPAETRGALVLFLAYGCVFFVTVQRYNRIDDVERLVRWCALATAVMAVFALLQLATSNGKFFWFLEHPFSDTRDVAKGSFVNRNHFAQFMALGIGPLLWWMQDALRRLQTPGRSATVPSPATAMAPWLVGVAIGLVLIAGLLSLSRGGIAAMFLAGAVCGIPLARRKALPGSLAAALLIAALAIPAGLALTGYDLLDQRMDDLTAGSVERLDGTGPGARRTIWATLATAIPHHAWAGSGVGTHGELHQRYLPGPTSPDSEYTHAENSYLQLALEAGLPGLLLALVGIGLCAAWCVAGMRSESSRAALLAPALLATLVASTAHALVDIVWHVPACVVLLMVQAACAYRLRVTGRNAAGRFERRVAVARPVAVGAVVLALAAGGWMLADRLGPALGAGAWNRFELAHRDWHTRWRETDEANLAQSPDTQARLIAAQRRAIGHLEDVVRRHPEHGRARIELAQGYLRLFGLKQLGNDNPMSLRNIRDAAVHSGFPTRDALQTWLDVAVGGHVQYLDHAAEHAAAAVHTCPLLAPGYLHLAELAFLEPGREQASPALVEQAVRLRPMDGEVLYAAAVEAWLSGDGERWLELARRAFHCGPFYQRQILRDLVGHAHSGQLPATIDLVVRHFEPDIPGLRALESAASRHGTAEQLAPLRRYYAETTTAAARGAPRQEAVQHWLEAQRMYTRLGETELALASAREAAQLDPNSYNVRHALAMRLLDHGQYAEAEQHLYWCLQRRPGDAGLETRWKTALKHKLDSAQHAGAKAKGVMR